MQASTKRAQSKSSVTIIANEARGSPQQPADKAGRRPSRLCLPPSAFVPAPTFCIVTARRQRGIDADTPAARSLRWRAHAASGRFTSPRSLPRWRTTHVCRRALVPVERRLRLLPAVCLMDLMGQQRPFPPYHTLPHPRWANPHLRRGLRTPPLVRTSLSPCEAYLSTLPCSSRTPGSSIPDLSAYSPTYSSIRHKCTTPRSSTRYVRLSSRSRSSSANKILAFYADVGSPVLEGGNRALCSRGNHTVITE